MKAPNDPNATPQNKQNRNGSYVPTTFRFSPEDLDMLDALCKIHEEQTGHPTTRAQWFRAIIRTSYRAATKPPRTARKPPKPQA